MIYWITAKEQANEIVERIAIDKSNKIAVYKHKSNTKTFSTYPEIEDYLKKIARNEYPLDPDLDPEFYAIAGAESTQAADLISETLRQYEIPKFFESLEAGDNPTSEKPRSEAESWRLEALRLSVLLLSELAKGHAVGTGGAPDESRRGIGDNYTPPEVAELGNNVAMVNIELRRSEPGRQELEMRARTLQKYLDLFAEHAAIEAGKSVGQWISPKAITLIGSLIAAITALVSALPL